MCVCDEPQCRMRHVSLRLLLGRPHSTAGPRPSSVG